MNNSIEPSIISDIPHDLKDFIVSIVNSYAAWDILTFFYDAHRPIKADLDDVASSIGRDIEQVKSVFDLMQEKEILLVTEKEGKKIFVSNLQGKMYNVISKFLQFTATREGRLKTIYLITSEKFKRVE